MNCKGGSVHWQYNDTSQQLRNQHIEAPASPLGVRVCEGAVKPKAGDSLAVGIPPDQPEQCPTVDLEWVLDRTTGYIRHVDTGLCLTIPPHKSAVLQTCGDSNSEGQKYVWDGDMFMLAPGMFRAGECLGYINNTRDSREALPQEPATDKFNLCVATQDLYCNTTRWRQVLLGYPDCKACLAAHAATLKSEGKCNDKQMQVYCGSPVGPAPRGPGKPPKGSGTVVMKSRDSGLTWSAPELIAVNNTWGPSYAGNDVAHGIEMVAEGPHKGRLAIARRYDVRGAPSGFDRSFVLYSDDQGLTWTAGQLLPQGWTECQVAELKNGSLVLTSRLVGFGGFYCTGNQTNCFQRGFARSDDGGATWSRVWYLEERQPDIIVNNCENALASDPATGMLYWGHPGAANMTRANYTVHQSTDGGLTWTLLDRVYEHGAGYSDVHVLHDASGQPYLGALFQRTLYEPGIEGGGYNLALASVRLN